MSSPTYAFILNGSSDWKTSVPDDWDWEIVELEGNEKVAGHHKIDGSVYKILQINNKFVAVAK